jgi:hypothetical protein
MSVKEILREINALGEADQLKLQSALARRLEQQYQAEAAKARKVARTRRITQSTIDRAIERRRYGR